MMRTRPQAVRRTKSDPRVSEVRAWLSKDSASALALVRGQFNRGHMVGVSQRYSIPKLNLYGRIDAVFQNTKNQLQLLKLSFSPELDRFKEITYLDVLGFKQIYGKPPNSLFLIDIVGRKKVSLTVNPQSDIIEALSGAVERLRAGDIYRSPSEHCLSCEYRRICDNRK
jgi:hypothetical protein